MSFTAIEADGPGGEQIVVAQTDGTAISAHVGSDRVVRMAPGLLGVTGGQPYIDPQGATVGEQATLGYDPASGSLFIELATDPAVIGLKLARAQRERTASAPKPVRPAKARPAGRPSGQPRRAKVRRQAQTLGPGDGREDRDRARRAIGTLNLAAGAYARAQRNRVPVTGAPEAVAVTDAAVRLAAARENRDGLRAAATLPGDADARARRESARHTETLPVDHASRRSRDTARQAPTLAPDPRSHASRAAARTVVTLPTDTAARDQREQGRHMPTERTAV